MKVTMVGRGSVSVQITKNSEMYIDEQSMLLEAMPLLYCLFPQCHVIMESSV